MSVTDLPYREDPKPDGDGKWVCITFGVLSAIATVVCALYFGKY